MMYRTRGRASGAAAQQFRANLRKKVPSTYVYTYPFKGAYRPLNEMNLIARAWQDVCGLVNIYVHVPYCEMKCSFCNLFTTTRHNAGAFEQYTNAVIREAQLVAHTMRADQLFTDSVYFGGGTPSLLPTEAVARIAAELRALFPLSEGAELAIETAPNAVDDEKLRELRSIGIDRISIGVQSFDARELQMMRRAYKPDLSERTISAALAAGFSNVNVDLIYGLPGQTDRTWRANLELAVALGVPTITIYPLTLRERTAFGNQHRKAPAAFDLGATTYRRYDVAEEFLTDNGYHQYSMSGFARHGGGSRHECNEFMGVPTVGLGASALSYAPDIHYTSGDYLDSRSPSSLIADYIQSVEASCIPIHTGILLSREERQRRHLIMRLLYQGVDLEEYGRTFGESLEDRFGSELEALAQEECVCAKEGWLALSPRGRRFSSLVADLLASATVKCLARAYK